MKVYDKKVGINLFSIAVLNGEVRYIQINGRVLLDPMEFEEMYQHYLDFDVEAASERDESNAG